VLEKDIRCMPALEEIKAAYRNKVQIFNVDALEFNARHHLTGPVRIVSNLPYNVGTELLIRWLTPGDWPPFWETLTLMFQKEVAERIIAAPGSKAYGRLSILAQWKANAKIVMALPPEAFSPPPKVHSAVVHLTALTEPRFPAPERLLSSTVAMAFNQRRKMLRSSLKAASKDIEMVLRDAGLEPTARAEEISLEGFCALARGLAPS
jgi:16S rRNA (adenine1518-N6/adenine1519-N6)-dimethyltransferase